MLKLQWHSRPKYDEKVKQLERQISKGRENFKLWKIMKVNHFVDGKLTNPKPLPNFVSDKK